MSFFSKNYKDQKEFVFKYCPFLYGKVREKKKFAYHVKDFFLQNCAFYRMEIRRTVLKQPIRIEYLIKQKPRGALALQVNRIADRQKLDWQLASFRQTLIFVDKNLDIHNWKGDHFLKRRSLIKLFFEPQTKLDFSSSNPNNFYILTSNTITDKCTLVS